MVLISRLSVSKAVDLQLNRKTGLFVVGLPLD